MSSTIPSLGGRGERYCPTCERSFPGGDQCPDDGTRLVLFDASVDRLLGTTLDGRYTIVERLGAGGMGAVYRANQLSMGREVAVKVVSPRLVSDAAIVKRFLREAKLASRLVHPNAVAILDFGQDPSTRVFFLVMELLAGQTLEAALQPGAFPPSRAMQIATRICDALDGAHALRVVHRDLKPANVFLVLGAGGRDLVKVLDFGLAKSLSTSDDRLSGAMTQSGAVLGTPLYMPPELAGGRELDARADLYSLGCMFYEMLAGAPPFTGATVHEIIAKHAAAVPAPLEHVPARLAEIVMRLLEKDPDQRFASAAAVQKALSALVRLPETGKWLGLTLEDDVTVRATWEPAAGPRSQPAHEPASVPVAAADTAAPLLEGPLFDPDAPPLDARAQATAIVNRPAARLGSGPVTTRLGVKPRRTGLVVVVMLAIAAGAIAFAIGFADDPRPAATPPPPDAELAVPASPDAPAPVDASPVDAAPASVVDARPAAATRTLDARPKPRPIKKPRPRPDRRRRDGATPF